VPSLIAAALMRHRTCSNDPRCKTRKIGDLPGDPQSNGVACHSSLFVAETICERRNPGSSALGAPVVPRMGRI